MPSGTVEPFITTPALLSNAVASKLATVFCGPSVPIEILVTGAATLAKVVRFAPCTISSTTFFADGSTVQASVSCPVVSTTTPSVR